MILYDMTVFIAGLVAGMLINRCIDRYPEEESKAKTFARCAGCGRNINAIDVIPLLGYFMTKGRYICCKAKKPALYPMVELFAAFVFLLLFKKYMFSAEYVAASYLMGILIAAFFIDIKYRIIPNRLVFSGLAGAIMLVGYNFLRHGAFFGNDGWWSHLIGMLPGSGILLILATIGIVIYKNDDVMGMGDVKVFAPIGIFLGWKLCIVALMLSVTIAGFICLVLLLLRLKNRMDAIPFGPFIAAGTFITLMWGQEILNWYLG